MRSWIWIGAALPIVACGTGTLEIGDELGSVEPGSDATDNGGTASDGEVDGETEVEPEPEPEPYAWAGSYTGMVEIFLWGNSWNICRAGDGVTFEMDDEGTLLGNGACEDGFGSYPLSFEGTANDDGRVSGEVLVEVPWEQNSIEETFDFGGWIGDDGLWLEWDSEIAFDGWDMPVAGEVFAE